MKITYLVVYGGDTCQDGTQCGPETKARCDTAIRFALSTEGPIRIILAAGKRPDKPAYPPLKEVMHQYLCKSLSDRKEVWFPPVFADAWGTYLETGIAATKIDRGADIVHICSSRHHLPRIRLIWRLLGEKARLVNVPAPTKNWLEVFLEPLKVIKAVITWAKN